MSRLSRADIDQLIDTLDRTTPERSDWRPAFERLLQNVALARRTREILRYVLAIAWLPLPIYFVVQLYLVGWDWSAVYSLPLSITLLTFLVCSSGAQYAVEAYFPVLRRHDRAVALLQHYGADIQADEQPELPPPHVVAALETLEKATEAAALGPAYQVVERWSITSQRSWSIDDFHLTVLWLFALSAALLGNRADIPDFWRGAGAMFVVLVAVWRLHQLNRRGAFERRVEDALGRWRHLTPAMQQPPP